MKNPIIPALALGILAAANAHAQTAASKTTQVAVQFQRESLRSADAAAQLLRRIEAAALEACGASSFSLREVRRATAASPCFEAAVASAVRRIDAPRLTAAARAR